MTADNVEDGDDVGEEEVWEEDEEEVEWPGEAEYAARVATVMFFRPWALQNVQAP